MKMTIADLIEILKSPEHENEHIEFKEAKNDYSILGYNKSGESKRKSVYGYAVALGNEGGGKLVLGVSDDKKIVGTGALKNIGKVKERIFEKLRKRIEIDELFDKAGNRVLIIHLPPRGTGEVLKFYDYPLMRVNEELRVMDDGTQRNILIEGNLDFSAEIATGATIDDLSVEALERLCSLYVKSQGREVVDSEQLLRDLNLVTGEGITNAAIILCGSETAIQKYIPQSEIILQYRNEKSEIKYVDRLDVRKAYLMSHDEIWDRIFSRNQNHQIQEGMLTREIPGYNKSAIKEAVNNAVAHRDYRDQGSIVIKQSPQEFDIESPGGFLPGVTADNIIDSSKSRNRLVAESLQHLGFVQRAGQGMDTIFEQCITEGKGLPNLSKSSSHSVRVILSAMVIDTPFLAFLEKVVNQKQIVLTVWDMIILEQIRSQSIKLKLDQVRKYVDLGLVEKVGSTSDARYILEKSYYQSHGQSGIHSRLIGLSRESKRQLILDHLERNPEGAVLNDFKTAFSDLEGKTISNLLQDMKKDDLIKSEGSTRYAVWKVAKES